MHTGVARRSLSPAYARAQAHVQTNLRQPLPLRTSQPEQSLGPSTARATPLTATLAWRQPKPAPHTHVVHPLLHLQCAVCGGRLGNAEALGLRLCIDYGVVEPYIDPAPSATDA